MACRGMLRSTILIEPSLLRSLNFNSNKHHIASLNQWSCRFHSPKPPYSSSQNETPLSQDPVLKAISEISKGEGRVGQTTNVIIGSTAADDSNNEWLALDQKVNSYPTDRGFTAIGTGGEDFVQAMVVAVESVIQQPIPQGYVKQKLSSGGKYVSVNIGPIQVVSSEQVQAVYNAMRTDNRRTPRLQVDG
ncbi:hypothetical protein GmHk_08G021837 [Glycine max]|nr:hypothetical protein GmHk_08G021837 [Glycine max]